jgi:putative ABC transport system ATP-binding protein
MSSNVSANAPQRANADSVLKVVNLTKQVSSPEGPLAIVHDVTFDIARGETVAITGASGAGKSTLLAMLAGLDLPTSGHLWLDGQDLTVLSEDGRARLRALTALENVLLPLELAQRANPQVQAREALDRVGLAPRVDHYPRQLSGGEQQRVALARAFVVGPAVLFADEPTGNLDAHTGQRIIDLMFDMNRTARTTLVLVTHEQPLATRCDRILHMQAGRLVAP